MRYENHFEIHKEIAEAAYRAIDDHFSQAVDLLSLFDVQYLVPGNPISISAIQADLKAQYASDKFDITLEDEVLSANVVGQTNGFVIDYNSLALNKIDDKSVARLIGNLSHELGHIFGYYHNSSFWGFNTSNRFQPYKAFHSVPYLLGYISYFLALGVSPDKIKFSVYDLAFNRGGCM